MAGMDATAARTHHMRQIVAEVGGPTEWVRRYGGARWTQAQVSQWISETKPKGIGGNLARDLERAMNLSHGALDRPPTTGAGASRSLRLSAPTVVNATQALRTFLGRRGIEYDPIDHAVPFVKVYEEAEKLSDKPTQQQLVAFASAVADIVQVYVGGGSR